VSSPIFVTLMMVALYSYGTLVLTRAIRRNIRDDGILPGRYGLITLLICLRNFDSCKHRKMIIIYVYKTHFLQKKEIQHFGNLELLSFWTFSSSRTIKARKLLSRIPDSGH
jgi:hypothetical protein